MSIVVSAVYVLATIYLVVGLALAIWMHIERRNDRPTIWETLATILILPFGLCICLAGAIMFLALAALIDDFAVYSSPE